MKRPLLAAVLACSALACPIASADPTWLFPTASRPVTIAVFGDWPYAPLLLDNAPLLVDSVNSDDDVSVVMHVGDIHSGSMPCTSAGILPALATADPGWNQKIYFQFQQFAKPLVYTPGDNEWTDCHKTKEKSSGAPLKELAAVRSLFFARPGHTLGLEDMTVLSQSQYFDPAHPADAQFVENVMWASGDVVFVTLNVPGSNNDTVPWSGDFAAADAQAAEVAARTAAEERWLESAFDLAAANHARAVVIGLQADMWDPEALALLLLNGDSHLYESDHPLADPASSTGSVHHAPAVPNLMRITVQGSTNGPAEWLRVTIDTRKSQPFAWSNVAYCRDPLTSCQ